MTRFVLFLWLTVCFVLAAPDARALDFDPRAERQVGWDLLPNGMLVVAYDLDRNGKADFFTVRATLKSYCSGQTVREVEEDFPGRAVFFANNETDRHFYITAAQPLFYAVDADEDGVWETIYKDAMEDGANGNEVYYDSGISK